MNSFRFSHVGVRKLTPTCLLLWLLLSLAPAYAADLLLLKRYTPDTEVTAWLMSEKLDGVRAHWTGSEFPSFPCAAWECRLDRVAVRVGMRRIQDRVPRRRLGT